MPMPVCGTLWCSSASGEDYGCRTQNTPWADGTTCGQGMWCQGAKCASKYYYNKARMVHGKWGTWNRCVKISLKLILIKTVWRWNQLDLRSQGSTVMLRKGRKDILRLISSTNRFDPVILNVNIIIINQSFLNVTTHINYLKCSPSKEKYGDTQALYTYINNL